MKFRGVIFLLGLMMLGRFSFPAFAETFQAWEILEETEDLGQYQIALGGLLAEGLELRFYGVSNGGDTNRDFAKIACYDSRGNLVGLFQGGRDNDGKESTTGWQDFFLVLPRKSVLEKVVLTIFCPGGSPRLVKHLSSVKSWDPQEDISFFPFSHEGKVSYSGKEALPQGKVWLRAAGMEFQKSSLDYAVWRSFRMPASPEEFAKTPDVTLDAAWAGTVNVVGDGFTGRGGYALALQGGVGQGSSISEAFFAGQGQCLERVASHGEEGFIMDLLENAGSGVLDIALDLAEATALGYFQFLVDSLSLVNTLFDIDESIVGAKRAVFEKIPLKEGERTFVWVRFRGVAAALGLAHSVISFYNDGPVEGDLRGNRALELGGVLLHFQGPRSPEVVATKPEGKTAGVSTTPACTIEVGASIQSLDKSRIMFRKVETGEIIPAIVYYEGKILTIKPEKTLDSEALYELHIGRKALNSPEGQNLSPFVLTFATGVPFMVYASDPPDGVVGCRLTPVIRLWFNRAVLKYGERFTEIVIKNTAGNVVAHPERVEDDSLGTSAIGLYFPRLQHATSYILEVPEGAFESLDEFPFPNLPYQLSFTTAPMIEVVGSEPASEEQDVPLLRYLSVALSHWAIPGPAYETITLQTEGKSVPLEKIPGNSVFYFSPLEPISPSTTYLLTIPEGAFMNPETEAFSRAFSLSFTTAMPPLVVWTSPREGATEVFRDEPVVVAFSEPIRLDLVRDETFFPEVDGEKVSLTVSTFENLLVLRPELPYPAFPPESQIQSP